MASTLVRTATCAAILLLGFSGAVRAQVAPQARPPAPPATPPAPAAPAAPGTQSVIDGPVRDALLLYAAALESLDPEQVKKVQPSVDVEGLRRAFREMRELKVSIDSIKVLSIEGATARVSCRVVQALTPRAGTKQTSTVTRVFRLRKQEAVWLIDGFER